MNEKLPLSPIRSERDLELYSKFLTHDASPSASSGLALQATTALSKPLPKSAQNPESFNAIFMPAFLREQLGKKVQAEFLVGEHLEPRSGTLAAVGEGYLVLQRHDGSLTVCDMNAIRFITILPPDYRGF